MHAIRTVVAAKKAEGLEHPSLSSFHQSLNGQSGCLSSFPQLVLAIEGTETNKTCLLDLSGHMIHEVSPSSLFLFIIALFARGQMLRERFHLTTPSHFLFSLSPCLRLCVSLSHKLRTLVVLHSGPQTSQG